MRATCAMQWRTPGERSGRRTVATPLKPGRLEAARLHHLEVAIPHHHHNPPRGHHPQTHHDLGSSRCPKPQTRRPPKSWSKLRPTAGQNRMASSPKGSCACLYPMRRNMLLRKWLSSPLPMHRRTQKRLPHTATSGPASLMGRQSPKPSSASSGSSGTK